jgi:CPA2 family monovalent cation:H+ antiporter-2
MVPWLKHFLDGGNQPIAIAEDLPQQDHVVVCGYGQIGRNIVRLLQDHQYPVVVIEQSEQAIEQLRAADIPYVYGNAVSLHVMEAAGVDRAKGMAIALPDSMSTRLCLKRALELTPDLDVVVRAEKDKDIELLYQLGAREVVQPEFEVSLELSSHLLTGIGIPLPIIQREVQQIRNSHYFELRPEQSSDEISRSLKAVAQEMNSRWLTLPPGSPLAEMTLDETNLRRLTGVSIIAIEQSSGEKVDYPNGETVLHSGDRLLVVGESNELAAFSDLASGQAAMPREQASCQWLLVPADSPAVGKTLAEVHIRRQFGVLVQAIRREGKFIRFPDGNSDVEAGDRLLLCGGFHALNQARQWLAPLAQPLMLPLVTVNDTLSEYISAGESVESTEGAGQDDKLSLTPES